MTGAIPFDAASVPRLPLAPGVYMLGSARGEILYVGKAKSLRHRVRSYLSQARDTPLKTRELVRQATAVETLVVGSEAEALILEANLIKEHQPRFNIQLRDDKRYPYIRVTAAEPYPRIHVTRRIRKDGSRYFGPFTSVGRVRRALEVVKRNHGIRSCRYDLPVESPSRPCLDHHIGRCAAPCVGLQSQEDYRARVDEVVRILSGDVAAVQVEVETEMRKASDSMDFERAAHLRDVLAGLDGIARQQRVQTVGGGDRDVIGLARDGPLNVASTLRVRDGVLIGRDTHRMTGAEGASDAELIARSLAHAYLSGGLRAIEQLPREVLLPVDFTERRLFQEVLTDKAGRRVRLHIPKRGAKVRLIDLAVANARHVLDEQVRKGQAGRPGTDEVLYELQDVLRLKVVPRLITCFDVSHTQGAETVAGAVTFLNGEPHKAGYRHMRIRGEWGNDDYRSMAEAVTRYFRRATGAGSDAGSNPGSSAGPDAGSSAAPDAAPDAGSSAAPNPQGPLPDLVVIDGGRGQLSAVRQALEALELGDITLAALAKREEMLYLPGRRAGLRIPRTARSLHLLQRIRDEAHRFAVHYNRKLRSRRTVRSALGDIPGIGPQRQQALLSRFGSLKGVREATASEIGRIPGFSEATGVKILHYLKSRTA